MKTIEQYTKLWEALNELVMSNFKPLAKDTWFKLELNIKETKEGETYINNVCLILDDNMPMRFIQIYPEEK